MIRISNPVKEFILKALLICFPFLLLFCLYVIADPFKVLYRYKNYYYPAERQSVVLNRDMITTETLIRNYPVYEYDSYIFGNSRSYFYRTSEWGKLIGSTKCFHYNANDESLYGVVQKLKYLDRNNYLFENALFVFDIGLLKQTQPNKGHIFIKHPIYTNQSWIEYQTEFLKSFYVPRFLISYFDYKISGKFKGYMKQVMNDNIYDYDIEHNELFLNEVEDKIKSDSIGFYNKKRKIFYERSVEEKLSLVIIKEEQELLLGQMAEILKKSNISFRIIISPLYDQKKISPIDKEYLMKLFGANRVFDFSGKNQFTIPLNHYYENSHYRPSVATQLMKISYHK